MPSFVVRGASSLRVYVVFDTPVLVNAALTDPSNYTLTDAEGTPLTVTSVSMVTAPSVRSINLTLDAGTPIQTHTPYVLTLSGSITTEALASYSPSGQGFRWAGSVRSANIPMGRFTGEVTGGLFGNPEGLVFFSPSLTTPVANSSIQVDSVSACTRAYDVYTVPSMPDPEPLYLYKSGAPESLLGTSVLFSTFDRLTEFKIDLTDVRSETFAVPVSSRAIATLSEPYDPDYVSLLNNPAWTLNGVSGMMFIAADILGGPIPSGSTTVITLEP